MRIEIQLKRLSIAAGLAFVCALCLAQGASADTAALSQVGSSGSVAGQLDGPAGVAVDGAGNVFVGDQLNNRISEFTAAGTFIRAFGADVIPGGGNTFEVCTAVTTCKAGLGGGAAAAGAGALSFPAGLVLDGAGKLYVNELGNRRVSEFNVAGTPTFTQAFGADVVPGAPTGFESCTTSTTCKIGLQSQFEGLDGIALTGTNLFVADPPKDAVTEISVDGAPSVIATVGGIDSPAGVAADASNLYITGGANRVDQYSLGPSPTFVQAFGGGVLPGSTGGFEVCTSAETTCDTGDFHGSGGDITQATGLALDGAGRLAVADDGSERIDEFGVGGTPTFTQVYGADVGPSAPEAGAFETCSLTTLPPEASCSAGTPGSAIGQFDSPHAATFDCRGALWVADLDNDRLQRFGPSGTALPPCGAPPQRTLTVTTAGTGSGTVSGSGISCPGDCSESYADGTTVMLTATPGSSSSFAHWGGACTGTGACSVTLSANAAVSATFTTSQPPPDTTAPQTEIDGAKKTITTKKAKAKVKLSFSASEAGSSFECRLDDDPFKPCSSPKTYSLKPGKYEFDVRATDAAGNTDATPAAAKFKVKRKR